MDFKDFKATLIILGAVLGLLLVIIIPSVIFSNKREEKTNFPEYEKIEIVENDIADISSDSYLKIKSRLEFDPYFKRETLISNHDSSEYTGENLRNMVKSFIFSYSLNNRKYMTSFNTRKEVFCMKNTNVIKAFKELYNVNITDQIGYFEGFDDYVTVNKNKICFNYGVVAKDYTNDILIGIKKIDVSDRVVTTDLYLYEYYTTYTTEELINISEAKKNISLSNFEVANSVVTEKLHGKVTHKLLQFYILNNGEHFKYQILLSKNLDN